MLSTLFNKKLLLTVAAVVACVVLPVSSSAAATLPVTVKQTKVIVVFTLPVATPGSDTGAAITQATNTLLATLPVGDYTVTNRYSTLPMVALSAGPATLSVLALNGLVSSVEADQTVHASSSSKTSCAKLKGKKKAACKKANQSASVVH